MMVGEDAFVCILSISNVLECHSILYRLLIAGVTSTERFPILGSVHCTTPRIDPCKMKAKTHNIHMMFLRTIEFHFGPCCFLSCSGDVLFLSKRTTEGS